MIKLIKYLEESTVDKLIEVLEQYKDKKLSITGLDDCYIHIEGDYIILDTENLDNEMSEYNEEMCFGFNEIELSKLKQTEDELKNNHLSMIKKAFSKGEDIILELSEKGYDYIFSDQVEDEKAESGWISKCVPLENHFFYYYKRYINNNIIYHGYVWTSEEHNWLDEFSTFEELYHFLLG